MKISYITDSLTAGGKERQLYYLINSMSTSHNVQLILFDNEIFFSEIYNLPIDLIIIPKQDRYKLSTQIKLYKKLKIFSPHIIHVWDKISQLMIMPYHFSHKVKTINGSIRHGGTIKYNLKTNLIRKLSYRFADIIVANSYQGLIAEGLSNNKKSMVIYNGIKTQLSIYRTKEDDIYNTTKNFDINVVMVGRFFPAKDYLSYIQVAKEIISNYNNIAFHCIGDGPLRVEAEKDSGCFLNRNIFFWGKRTDVRNILVHFDIGVLLNNTKGHAEGLSNAIMEYMVAKLPVIATDAGGTKELVKNKQNGYLVPAFDITEITNRLNVLINNESLRVDFGNRGHEIIKNNFSIKKMVENYEKLYSELINEL